MGLQELLAWFASEIVSTLTVCQGWDEGMSIDYQPESFTRLWPDDLILIYDKERIVASFHHPQVVVVVVAWLKLNNKILIHRVGDVTKLSDIVQLLCFFINSHRHRLIE